MATAAGSTVMITHDSRLSEDYVLTNDVLVAGGTGSPIATILMPDGSHSALAVVAGEGLQHVVRDATSASGWNLRAMPSGASATEVAVGLDAAGQTHAFYQDGTHTYHAVLQSDGTWSQPDAFGPSQSLGTAKVPLQGAVIAYGVTSDGNLLFMRKDPKGSTWQAVPCDCGDALLGAQVMIKMVTATAWSLAAVVGGQLKLYTGVFDDQGAGIASGPNTVTTPNPVRGLHFAYAHRNSTMWMFTDSTNTLYTSVGFSDQVSAIPTSQVAQGTGIVGTDGKVRFYGVDPTGSLWVLHQTSWGSDGITPVWAPIFPLDVNTVHVAAPVTPQDGATMFALGADQTLHTIIQDPVTQAWTRLKAQRPDGQQPYNLTRWRTQLTVTDAYGNPAIQVGVTVSASTQTAILCRNQTYFIGPGAGESATLMTDGTGLLTFSCPAMDYNAAYYLISAPGLAESPLKVYPNEYVQAFLAGSAPIHTGSQQVPNMSATTLQNATLGGQPLFPKLSSDLAQQASSGIQSAMASVPSAGAPTAALDTAAGWALDLRDLANPRFTRFQSAEELVAYKGGLRTNVTADDFWGDVGQFFGDVWNAIKSGAMQVVHWVVDVAKKVVSFAVKVGDAIHDLGEMVIKGVEDAISLVHSILNAIGAALEKVLDWIKDLLGWDKIWHTKLVFEHLVEQAIPALQWLIEKRAVAETGSFFQGLKSTIDGGLTTVAEFLANKPIGSLGGDTSESRVALAASATQVRTPADSIATSWAQNNWLLSKLIDHMEEAVLGPLTSTLPTNLFDELFTRLSEAGLQTDLQNALTNIKDFFSTVYQDPDSITTKGAADLVRAAQAAIDFVIDLLDALVKMVLDIIASALGDLDTVLTQPLGEIPVVSWIYRNVICPSDQQEDPSILRLAALLLAIPVTLIYELANDGDAPFSEAQTEAILKWRFQPPAAAAAALMAEDSGGISAATRKTITFYLSVAQASVDMAADGFSSTDEGQGLGSKVSGWADLVINSVMQVLTWPGDTIFNFDWDWSGMHEGEKLQRVTWILSWAPLLLNAGLLVIPSPASGRIAEGIDIAGKTALVVLGAASLGVGLAGSIIGMNNDKPASANGWDVASSTLGPLANFTQFLRYNGAVEGSEGITLIIKLLLNDVGDVGAAWAAMHG